jgi:hypothetical protein
VNAETERKQVKNSRVGLAQISCPYKKRVDILNFLGLRLVKLFDLLHNATTGRKKVGETSPVVNLGLLVSLRLPTRIEKRDLTFRYRGQLNEAGRKALVSGRRRNRIVRAIFGGVVE